jgi:hypothetical protein
LLLPEFGAEQYVHVPLGERRDFPALVPGALAGFRLLPELVFSVGPWAVAESATGDFFGRPRVAGSAAAGGSTFAFSDAFAFFGLVARASLSAWRAASSALISYSASRQWSS